MTAEGNLYNPGIFEDKYFAIWYLCDEYLQICRDYPDSATAAQAKAHLFKMYHAW